MKNKGNEKKLIHFMGAVDGNIPNYILILNNIVGLGHDLTTRHYVERKIADIKKETSPESTKYVEKFQEWIHSCDIAIFEVTKPDISIGFELSYAHHILKTVIVLFDINHAEFPFSLKGWYHEKLFVYGYSKENISKVIKNAIRDASKATDSRFNMFIPDKINNYLSKISSEKGISKASYIRNLIEKEMNNKK